MTAENLPVSVEVNQWLMLKEQAGMVVKTGLAPKEVDTAEKAAIIMLKGRELGLQAMESLHLIHVVHGKPGLSAKLILALIRKRYPAAPIEIERRDITGTTLWAGRPGQRNLTPFTFTIEDARRAELLGNPTWKKYPQKMCYYRAVSDMADALYPECLMSEQFAGPIVIDDEDDDGIIETVRVEPPAPLRIGSSEDGNDVPFDGSARHVADASAILKKSNIPEQFWNTTLQRMKGKRPAELLPTARGVIAEHENQELK